MRGGGRSRSKMSMELCKVTYLLYKQCAQLGEAVANVMSRGGRVEKLVGL